MILFADYFDQLTVVTPNQIEEHLSYYKVTNIQELQIILGTLTAENPWFYVECPDKLLLHITKGSHK